MYEDIINDFVAAMPRAAAALAHLYGGAPETASPERIGELLLKRTPDRAAFVDQVVAEFQAM